MKNRIIAVLLIVSMFTPMSAVAITDSNSVKTKTKTYKEMSTTKRKKQNDTSYRYGYVNLDWWEQFGDRNLDNYILRAIEHNQDLKMASLSVKEYYQYVKLEFANELPTIGIGVSPGYAKIPDVNGKWSFIAPGLVQYEADIFLKNRDKTKSTKKLYEAVKCEERGAYIAVASAVGSVYFNLVKINEVIALQEQIVSSRKEIYNLMQLRHEEGITSTSDLVKANKAYIYGQSELTELKKNREKLLTQLAVLIGESPENIAELKISKMKDIKFSGNIPTSIPTDVIISRPDYMAAEKMIEKAGIDVRVAKKEFLPTFNLTGLGAIVSGLPISNGAVWATAVAAVLPLFTGGARVANLKLKKVQYDKILQNYYKTNLTAIKEVNDALSDVKHDKVKLTQNLENKQLEAKDFIYTTEKYNNGVISKLDLLQMKENLLIVDKMVVNSQVDCYLSYIGLYKSVGSKL